MKNILRNWHRKKFCAFSLRGVNNCMSWLCLKCKTKSENHTTRCSFCGEPRPIKPAEQTIQEQADLNLRQSFHRAVDRMNNNQLKRAWRWLEDNIL